MVEENPFVLHRLHIDVTAPFHVRLTDEKKARRLEKEKRKQAKVARSSGVELVDEAKEAARKALAENAKRDRELNLALNSKAERKAINAQIKQLIDNNKLDKGQGDIGFNFTCA